MHLILFTAGRVKRAGVVLTLTVAVSLLAVTLPRHALAGGGAGVAVNRWDRNVGTGLVSYDVTLTVTGAAAPGQPCQGSCGWRIELWHHDGLAEVALGSLAAGPADRTNDFTITRTGTDVLLPEVTHVRAVVEPRSLPTNATVVGDWVTVSEPYPDGIVDVAVHSWQKDEETGTYTYDLTMSWAGAAQRNGPCVGYCRWNLALYYRDDEVDQYQGGISGGVLYANKTWWSSFPVKGSVTKPVTHLKATLAPYDAASTAERYESWFYVGNVMVQDENLEPYAVLLAPTIARAAGTFCDVLLLRGGPSLRPPSSPDTYDTCIALVGAGVAASALLYAIAREPGGLEAIHELVRTHVHSGPIPSDEPRPTPLPPQPGPGEHDGNDCHQDILITSDSVFHVEVESPHIWESRVADKSWFFEGTDWQQLAMIAEGIPPYPSPSYPVNCLRVVTYWKDVGWDMNHKSATDVYTVVTDRQTGELRTIHPGAPR